MVVENPLRCLTYREGGCTGQCLVCLAKSGVIGRDVPEHRVRTIAELEASGRDMDRLRFWLVVLAAAGAVGFVLGLVT